MASRTYTDFTPSHKAPPDPACKRLGPAPADERFEVSIYLKARAGDPGFGSIAVTRRAGLDLREHLGSWRAKHHADDFKLVQEFAHEHGLSVLATVPAQ